MAALPPVAKVIRYDFRQLVGANTRILNRLFFQYSGALSTTDLTTLLATASSSWLTNMVSLFSTIHSLLSITGTDLSSSTAPQVVNTTVRTGTGGYQNIPQSASLIMKFKINRRYRGGHPRSYWSGQGLVNQADSQTWNTTEINVWNTNFAAFIAACVASPPAAVGTLTHVNVNYFKGFHNVTFPSGRQRAVPTALATPNVDPIVAYLANPRIGSQRRRLQQSP